MNWELEESPGFILLRPVENRLDAVVAPGFREEIAGLTARVKKALVLDLVNVEFMDSSGLGAVVVCYKQMQNSGGMYVCNVGPQVRDIFRLTHMDRILDVSNTFDECLQKLAA